MFQFSTEFKLYCHEGQLVRLFNELDLENFLKCWNQDFDDSCDPISNMLGAESVNDPKIKVVPYVKHYNFALVNSSMQGL